MQQQASIEESENKSEVRINAFMLCRKGYVGCTLAGSTEYTGLPKLMRWHCTLHAGVSWTVQRGDRDSSLALLSRCGAVANDTMT